MAQKKIENGPHTISTCNLCNYTKTLISVLLNNIEAAKNWISNVEKPKRTG